jgi:hypothetical protein
VLSLSQLGTALSDTELRMMLKSVLTRKISADLKTVQAHAELSKRLTQNRRKTLNGEGDELRQIIKEHLEYYGTLVDLSMNFHQRLLDKLARSAESASDPAVNGLTLAMTAPIGATVRAPFKISNNRPDSITVKCRASPFVSEDGSQLIASGMAFDPPGLEIASGSDEIFEAILPVTPDFVAGKLYLATLSADGFDAMSIVIRLQVEGPAVESAPPRTKKESLGADISEAATASAAKSATAKRRSPAKRKPTATAKASSRDKTTATQAPRKAAKTISRSRSSGARDKS